MKKQTKLLVFFITFVVCFSFTAVTLGAEVPPESLQNMSSNFQSFLQKCSDGLFWLLGYPKYDNPSYSMSVEALNILWMLGRVIFFIFGITFACWGIISLTSTILSFGYRSGIPVVSQVCRIVMLVLFVVFTILSGVLCPVTFGGVSPKKVNKRIYKTWNRDGTPMSPHTAVKTHVLTDDGILRTYDGNNELHIGKAKQVTRLWR